MTELDRVAVPAPAAGTRRTTAEQLLAGLASRTRYPRRRWTEEVLRDVGAGTCSVLEHRYLTGVERAHGLPRAVRQQRERGITGVVCRDVILGTAVVELDGRLHHDDPAVPDGHRGRGVPAAARHRGVRPPVRPHLSGRATGARVHRRRCWHDGPGGLAGLTGRRGCSTR